MAFRATLNSEYGVGRRSHTFLFLGVGPVFHAFSLPGLTMFLSDSEVCLERSTCLRLDPLDRLPACVLVWPYMSDMPREISRNRVATVRHHQPTQELFQVVDTNGLPSGWARPWTHQSLSMSALELSVLRKEITERDKKYLHLANWGWCPCSSHKTHIAQGRERCFPTCH